MGRVSGVRCGRGGRPATPRCRAARSEAEVRWRLAQPPERLSRRSTLSLKLQIELVYDPGCPNVGLAREVLTTACRELNVPAVWTEWSSEDPRCPGRARNLGSPSILVNGEDVAPGPHPWAERQPGSGPRCRVYRDGDAIVPAPPLHRVRSAIREALQPEVG